LNPIAVVGKFGPSEMFITTKKENCENSYQSNVTNEFNNNGDEVKVAIEMLNIVGIFQPMSTTIPICKCSSSPTTDYYVEMSHISTTPKTNHKENQLVVNLEDLTLESNDLIGPSQIQEVFGLANLLFLPRLLIRKRQCKKPLMDY